MAEGEKGPEIERTGYGESPLSKYLSDLAGRLPAPGGGSAAALLGAVGAALLSMVANFTVGKEKFRDVEEDVRRVLEESEALRARLLQLVDEDVRAYEAVSRAFKLPKGPERDEEIGKALREASQVPAEVLQKSFRVLELASELVDKGNPALVTDVGIAALAAHAAVESALLNVEINLKWMRDENFAEEMRRSCLPLVERGAALKEGVVRRVRERLEGRGGA